MDLGSWILMIIIDKTNDCILYMWEHFNICRCFLVDQAWVFQFTAVYRSGPVPARLQSMNMSPNNSGLTKWPVLRGTTGRYSCAFNVGSVREACSSLTWLFDLPMSSAVSSVSSPTFNLIGSSSILISRCSVLWLIQRWFCVTNHLVHKSMWIKTTISKEVRN